MHAFWQWALTLRLLCGKISHALRFEREWASCGEGSPIWKTHQKNRRMEVNYNRVDINERLNKF